MPSDTLPTHSARPRSGSAMFGDAFAFNYDISAWDTSKITDFR